jgi:hypothetical protein
MKKCIRNGTPSRTCPGRFQASIPARIPKIPSPNGSVSATRSMPRVHGDAGRTVVNAVTTK